MILDASTGHVLAVCRSPRHGFSKEARASIRLLSGRGVEGDAHCGETVQHLYLKRKSPTAPNLMQVHLLQSELLDELAFSGFDLQPGKFGENITTRNIDLLTLPVGTRLHLGDEAIVELTGLRTPCKKIEDFCPGLLKQVVHRDGSRIIQAKAGVMAIVVQDGVIAPGAGIVVILPEFPHKPMQMI
ncbi:MOSC domain-containing protein [Terriglobus roseus]|uniref:MOSC domain-containing protein YiiM n=1 Tax=Terriglobus roseus TaxID=392734 RepID=A0A1H4R912_9BACT|nr:MOSC domain-containing protein [Terriglobus roseus]SEC28355.1 MOSC domain-containing protein YiiM [Terriglobus roseus]